MRKWYHRLFDLSREIYKNLHLMVKIERLVLTNAEVCDIIFVDNTVAERLRSHEIASYLER